MEKFLILNIFRPNLTSEGSQFNDCAQKIASSKAYDIISSPKSQWVKSSLFNKKSDGRWKDAQLEDYVWG